jgi:hypothetical protein
MGSTGWDSWFDSFMDWAERWVFNPLLVFLVVIFAVICVAYYAFCGVSRWPANDLCVSNDPLTVESLHHRHAYSTTVIAGNVIVPIHHPESFSASVFGKRKTSGEVCTNSISLSATQYAELGGER